MSHEIFPRCAPGEIHAEHLDAAWRCCHADVERAAPVKRVDVRTVEAQLRVAVRAAVANGKEPGIFLTSGHASAVLLAMARAETAGPLRSYLVGFDESTPSSDFAYAARLARRFGSTHQEIMVPAIAVAQALPYIIAATRLGPLDSRAVSAALLGLFAAPDTHLWLCGVGALPAEVRPLAGDDATVGEMLREHLADARGGRTISARDAAEQDARCRAWRAVATAHGAHVVLPFVDAVDSALRPRDRVRLMRALAEQWLPGEVARRRVEVQDVPLRAWLRAALDRDDWRASVEASCRRGSVAHDGVHDPRAASAESVVAAWHLLCLVLRNRYVEIHDEIGWRTPPGNLPVARVVWSPPATRPPGAAGSPSLAGDRMAVRDGPVDRTPHASSPRRRRRRARPVVVVVGPLPPPLGGVQTANELLLLSHLADEIDFHVVDTSKKRVRWAPETTTWRSPVWLVQHASQLVRLLVTQRPDAVYVHATAGYAILRDFVMMALARLGRVPVICHYHGTAHTHFPSVQTAGGRLLGRAIMAAASRIVCLGPSYRDAFAAAWQRQDLTVMPNLADAALAAGLISDAPPPWLGPGDRGLLFVGRLTEAKGIVDLLDAMPLILGRHPGARLLLMGVADTPEQEFALRISVRQRDIEQRVTFLGSMQGATKVLAYATAHVLVLPSLTEAFPVVIPEAMAAGLPMVVTNVGCIADYVRDGEDGFLIPPRDPATLADRVNRLLSDETLRARMAAHVAVRGRHEFDINVGAERMRAALAEVVPALREGPRD